MALVIRRREPVVDPDSLPGTLHPVVRRVYAARGVHSAQEIDHRLAGLLPPTLGGLPEAARLLADAVQQGRRIVIVGDYDADGATSTALGIWALRAMGAQDPQYIVPNRFTDGYGLSPALVDAARALGAELIVTVDNGITSIEGVARARAHGIDVIVTDHHLPGERLPQANAIVNPRLPGERFASPHLAGVGVMFYVLAGLRRELSARGWFSGRPAPRLAEGLDLVALGTVADLVRLDRNNRILVSEGLARMRAGRLRPGIAALLAGARRDPRHLTAQDLGYALGPRINAAGRMDDMATGIRCLLAEDPDEAAELAAELESHNAARRATQAQMDVEAMVQVEGSDAVGVSLYDPGWHEGVVGLVAGRVKERLHRPVVAFARAQQPGTLKGSARSIPGVHVRDLLAAVDAAHPGMILRYGGHAMAAGLSLREDALERFAAAFDEACRRNVDAELLEPVHLSDGPLSDAELELSTALALERAGPWGQGFPEPTFDGEFEIERSRTVGNGHQRYLLRSDGGLRLPAIHFGGAEQAATGRIRLLYQLVVDRWNETETLQLRVLDLAPA